MKTKILKSVTILGLIALMCCIFSCPGASPIIGKWADAAGNSIVFEKDGTFTANIKDSTNKLVASTGSFTVKQNVMIFETSDGTTILTEWDIRGAMMYLTWTDRYAVNKAMTLYKIK
ncbi:MAG: hypothetical protein ACTTHG_00645 [Treponemataceae bacterium]